MSEEVSPEFISGLILALPISLITGLGLVVFLDSLGIHENIIGIIQALWIGLVSYVILTISTRHFRILEASK